MFPAVNVQVPRPPNSGDVIKYAAQLPTLSTRRLVMGAGQFWWPCRGVAAGSGDGSGTTPLPCVPPRPVSK